MFWGNHLRYFGDKISLDRRSSLISLISRQNNAKHYRHYFDCDSLTRIDYESCVKLKYFRHCEAIQRIAEAIQTKIKIKNLSSY